MASIMLMHQMDAKTAYLNCELYVNQPKGYSVSDKGNKRLEWKQIKL